MFRFFHKIIITSFTTILCLLASVQFVSADISIIIDDVGYRSSDTRLLNLPAEITLSILPNTPFGKNIANRAVAEGREIMLHLPMESSSGIKQEPGTILSTMTAEQIKQTLKLALDDFPHISGVNNHMGSKLTQLVQPLESIMSVLKQRDLYFVDSRTSKSSQALSVALSHGLTAHRRHVFLDNEIDQVAINRQLNKVLKMATKQQNVIAIGHPHPETIAVLEAFFAKYTANAIMLRRVSELQTKPFQTFASNTQVK